MTHRPIPATPVSVSRFSILPLALCLLLFTFSCKYAAKKEQPVTTVKDKTTTEMPTPLPTIRDYADDWKIVDSLERQGLFKSALERTEAIYAKATEAKNSPQIIKALLYRGKYATQLEEDGLVKAIQMFEQEEKTARVGTKALLQSILGQLYATYLSNQGWRLSERTPVPDGQSGDILTWSAAQIEKRAIDLYVASAEPRPLLMENPVDVYRDILIPGEGDSVAGHRLRPSIHDFLAYRALEYFANDRSWLTEPAYAFQLDQAEAFAPRQAFVNTRFDTKDSTSGKWQALRIYQSLLRRPNQIKSTVGQPDKIIADTSALVSADLLRLQFVHNNSVRADKDSLYRRALESLHSAYQNHPIDGEIVYQLAQHIYNLSTLETGKSAAEAVTLLEDAIRRHPGTYGAQQLVIEAGELAGRIDADARWRIRERAHR